jgi:hypothetical protein
MSIFCIVAEGLGKGETLLALQTIPGNNTCADCDASNPDWISMNLGIIICKECSGSHRSLGVHISKVRSTTLDRLDSYMVQYLCNVGNQHAKQICERANKILK